MGVPQSSILSPEINNAVKVLLKGWDCALFVDDFAPCVRGKSLNRVERAVQLCGKFSEWDFRNWIQVFNLKNSVHTFLSTVWSFFPEPILVETNSMSCVIESRAEGRVWQTADTAVKQKQKETTADFRRRAVRFISQQTILQHHTMASGTDA